MGDERLYCILDYETRSEANLKKVGGWEYSVHPSTEILCVSWRVGRRSELRKIRPKLWSPFKPSGYGELIRALCDPAVINVAQNAYFEQVVTRNVLSRIVNRPELKTIPHSRWRCTAAQSAAMALPRKLVDSGAALGLPIQKDQEGHRLMLKMSKPRKATKKNKEKWHMNERDLDRLMSYCATDVEAETEIFLSIPELKPSEQALWELDQKINFRGFAVDRELIGIALNLIEEETNRLHRDTEEKTLGVLASTLQRDGMLEWLEAEGVFLPNLQKKTVEDALKAGLAKGDAKQLLEIRQVISKTSTKKYLAFEERTRSDGRLRDMLVFHAASTGRWGGSGVQPQNFPRGSVKNTDQAAEIIREGDLELVRMIYGDPMSVLSSCLRSAIVAPEGKELFVADYAAIEARVLFWVAKHESGIKAFSEGRDLYCEMASEIYGRKITKEDKFQRFVGKEAVLGCGYGMGWKKFVGTCEVKGQKVPDDLAQLAVKAYRREHAPVPKLWGNIERAAISAVLNPKKSFSINRVKWFMLGKFLYCELPSGRRLAYYDPVIKFEEKWGEKRPTLYHWDVHPKTRKWVLNGTWGGKLVENIVQGIARDFMAEAMHRVERAGYEVVLSVHDELVAENDPLFGSAKDFSGLMGELPAWGRGCPITVEGWQGPRYKK